MKTKAISLLVFCSLIFSGGLVLAKNKTKIKRQSGQQSTTSTDHTFQGSTVHGRYNYADEATATVENEKMLNRLLGVRTDFKDRLLKTSGQR